MYVVTADQVDSRSSEDLAGAMRDHIDEKHGARLLLPADRTAGDEIQALTEDAATVLTLILELTRSGQWSVGLGCGSVRQPLPSATREASGDAFFAARDAVIRAKKQTTRFALETVTEDEAAASWPNAADVESVINLLLALREHRSPAGWELYDLIAGGMTQSAAATRLGITPPSASARAKAAGLKIETASIGALTRLLEKLDRSDARRNSPA